MERWSCIVLQTQHKNIQPARSLYCLLRRAQSDAWRSAIKMNKISLLATFLAFFLGQLLPNIAIHSFIFHQVDDWTYSIPLIVIGTVVGIVLSFKPSKLRHIALYFLSALVGIISGYLIELVTYLLRVLHGNWPSEFWVGLQWHFYTFRVTVWRQLLPFTFILLIVYLVSKFRNTTECHGRMKWDLVLFIRFLDLWLLTCW